MIFNLGLGLSFVFLVCKLVNLHVFTWLEVATPILLATGILFLQGFVAGMLVYFGVKKIDKMK